MTQKNVVVNDKVFKVMVRVNSEFIMPMAQISRDGEVEWLDHNFGNDAAKEALDNFITELEWGRQNRRQQKASKSYHPKRKPTTVMMQYLLRSSGMMNSLPCMPLQKKITKHS